MAGGIGGFSLGTKLQDGKVQRAQIAAGKWKTAAEAWQANAKGWKASYSLSEQYRGEERREAVSAIDGASRECSARIAAVRASSRAMSKMLAKPVKLDGKGCPVRTLFDPKPILQPEVR